MTTQFSDQEFSYKLRGWSAGLMGFFLLIFAGMMVFMALEEPNKFFGVDVGNSVGTILYGALALASLASLFVIFRRGYGHQAQIRVITFGADNVRFPKSLSANHTITLRYDEIEDVALEQSSRTATKNILLRHGGTYTRISDMGFDDSAEFQAVYEQFRSRANLAENKDA